MCRAIMTVSQLTAPQMGKVRIQAETISPVTPQRTAENRRADATPIMDVLIVCVVLSGIPSRDASSIVLAAAISAAKP
jgi:hypothetical protein